MGPPDENYDPPDILRVCVFQMSGAKTKKPKHENKITPTIVKTVDGSEECEESDTSDEIKIENRNNT